MQLRNSQVEEMHKYGDHAQSFYALSQGATLLKSPPVHEHGKLPEPHLWGDLCRLHYKE